MTDRLQISSAVPAELAERLSDDSCTPEDEISFEARREQMEEAAAEKAAEDIGEYIYWSDLADERHPSPTQAGLLEVWSESTARIMRNAPGFLSRDWASTEAVREVVVQLLRVSLAEATRQNIERESYK